MSSFRPKGRKNLPSELLNFGMNLVYSEGTKTEPYYVESIKRSIADKYLIQPNDIDIITVNKNNESTNTIYLVQKAIDDVNKRIKKRELIDNVWIFYDKDDFNQNDYEKAFDAINSLNNSKLPNNNGFKYDTNTNIAWHACWSNEAFELWLCLYFYYDQAVHSRDQYRQILNNIPSLKKIGFMYSKNIENIHSVLTKAGGSIEHAIKYSKKLELINKRGNPSTGVYKFAEFFLKYMKK